jgi:hypothetical protein
MPLSGCLTTVVVAVGGCGVPGAASVTVAGGSARPAINWFRGMLDMCQAASPLPGAGDLLCSGCLLDWGMGSVQCACWRQPWWTARARSGRPRPPGTGSADPCACIDSAKRSRYAASADCPPSPAQGVNASHASGVARGLAEPPARARVGLLHGEQDGSGPPPGRSHHRLVIHADLRLAPGPQKTLPGPREERGRYGPPWPRPGALAAGEAARAAAGAVGGDGAGLASARGLRPSRAMRRSPRHRRS